jgi:NADPH:quinone reductase-like Zn-dependent oxidoreductase
MKAAVVEHRGDPGSIVEIPVPQPGPNDVLVRVVAAGVNPVDWKRRERPEQRLPFVLGQDFAGVVSGTGNRVNKYREGERVFGIAREHGSYAEYTLASVDAPGQPMAKIPDDVGDADAAALPTAGLTALAALETLAVRKGETLLVLGATGGVGMFAVQMARDRGARVIGTARAANEALARSLGVDDFVAYDEQDVVTSVRRAHPAGVDTILDLVDGKDAIERTGELLHEGGRIVSTIGAADVEWFAARKAVATNLALPEGPYASHAGLRTLLELLERGAIRVTIAGERALVDAVAALEESRSGSVDGKLVITVD